ncbi:zinc finger protein 691-like [Schistocerca cancellata]|uniref:zinc finger protein 691-like n=1 Tax=Schistocerca cancellata TaxID=274614 RepID=UPI0021181286|nr:zinc finger protein 691-like [Schistocerca cancellata]
MHRRLSFAGYSLNIPQTNTTGLSCLLLAFDNGVTHALRQCGFSGRLSQSIATQGTLFFLPGRPSLADAAEERLQQHVEAVATSLGRATAAPGHLCVYCGKLYSRKYGLKIHIRTHTGYKPLKCKVCLRAFGDPSNLNKHVRLHAEGQTPYRCDLCGKVLVRRRDLERHLKSRHCTWGRHDTSCDEVTQRTQFRVAELC